MTSEVIHESDGHEYRKGDRVRLDVEWPGGRIVSMEGSLISVRGDDAFVETDRGAVAGAVDTIEPA